jgi:hypothetical protein
MPARNKDFADMKVVKNLRMNKRDFLFISLRERLDQQGT